MPEETLEPGPAIGRHHSSEGRQTENPGEREWRRRIRQKGSIHIDAADLVAGEPIRGCEQPSKGHFVMNGHSLQITEFKRLPITPKMEDLVAGPFANFADRVRCEVGQMNRQEPPEPLARQLCLPSADVGVVDQKKSAWL